MTCSRCGGEKWWSRSLRTQASSAPVNASLLVGALSCATTCRAASGWGLASSRLMVSMNTRLSGLAAHAAHTAMADRRLPGWFSSRLSPSNRGFHASPSAATVSTSSRWQMVSHSPRRSRSPGSAAIHAVASSHIRAVRVSVESSRSSSASSRWSGYGVPPRADAAPGPDPVGSGAADMLRIVTSTVDSRLPGSSASSSS